MSKDLEIDIGEITQQIDSADRFMRSDRLSILFSNKNRAISLRAIT
jgi:hypothetical protein